MLKDVKCKLLIINYLYRISNAWVNQTTFIEHFQLLMVKLQILHWRDLDIDQIQR